MTYANRGALTGPEIIAAIASGRGLSIGAAAILFREFLDAARSAAVAYAQEERRAKLRDDMMVAAVTGLVSHVVRGNITPDQLAETAAAVTNSALNVMRPLP